MSDRPLLIAYDGSDEARHAIAVAASLFAGRAAVVVDVGPIPVVAESFTGVGPELRFVVSDEARARSEEGAELARHAGLEATARSVIETPTWLGIREVADEVDAAVIVMGSRGPTGLRELVRGGVSHGVAEHAGRPVLVVPHA